MPRKTKKQWPDVALNNRHPPGCQCKVCIPWRAYVRAQAAEGNPKAMRLILENMA